MPTPGPIVTFSQLVASGSTVSTGVYIGQHWDSIMLKVPTMTSGTDIYFKGSTDGTTYVRLYHAPTVGSSTPGAIFVNSSITQCIFPLPAQARTPYLQIELSTAMTATSAQFAFICGE